VGWHADVTLVARGACAVVSIVVFATLTSSAAGVTAGANAPVPGKRELRQAGVAFASRSRPAVDRRAVGRLTPSIRRLVRDGRFAAAPRATGSRRSASVLSAVESKLLEQMNNVRRSRGLRALKVSRGLSAAAAYHSRQMVQHGFFEHESRGGGPFWKRVERFYGSAGFRAWEVGENLAYGSPELSPAATVRMWMNSPGHRENLLSLRWREIGLGILHVGAARGEFAGSPVTVVTADFGYRIR
jgi:uncharacterized protein YkwD